MFVGSLIILFALTGPNKGVLLGVERKVAGNGIRSDQLGGCDKAMRGGISIIPSCEVPVE